MLRLLPCLFCLPFGLVIGSRPSRPLAPPPLRPDQLRTLPVEEPMFGFHWCDEPVRAD